VVETIIGGFCTSVPATGVELPPELELLVLPVPLLSPFPPQAASSEALRTANKGNL
jgi:hypothetical protein